jgi:hypothetical protein
MIYDNSNCRLNKILIKSGLNQNVKGTHISWKNQVRPPDPLVMLFCAYFFHTISWIRSSPLFTFDIPENEEKKGYWKPPPKILVKLTGFNASKILIPVKVSGYNEDYR